MVPSFLVRVGILLAAGLILHPAFGQRSGGGGGGGLGSTPGGTASNSGTVLSPNTTSTPANTTTQPTNPQPTQQVPIFISGQVLREDGTPPPTGTVIERVCSGQTHAEGYTDSKGYFAIQLFQRNNGVLQDASDYGTGRPPGMGGGGQMGGSGERGGMSTGMLSQDRMLMGCDLRARAPGYRSQTVSLASRRPMDPPDIGTILLHQNAPTEGSTVSAVSLAAPKDAQKDYAKAMEALKKNKLDEARKQFSKAVESYPKYAAAWQELGRLQAASGDPDSARKSFETAIGADPKFVLPYLELAMLDLQAHKWPELVDLTEKAVKLDPFDSPQAFYFNAVANYYLKNLDAAEKSAREADRLDTRHQLVQNHHLLGVLLAQHGDYAGAAEQFRAYLALAPSAADAATVQKQLDQVDKLVAQSKQ